MQTRHTHVQKNRQSPNTAHVPSGRSIAAIRVLLGIPAETLASSAQMSPYSLSRLERDHRCTTVQEMSRLVTILGKLMKSDDE